MEDRILQRLLSESRATGFEEGFAGRVMRRLPRRVARTTDVVVPLFWRTAAVAALLILGLATYNATHPASTTAGGPLETLFGVPSSTTVMDVYTHDIDTSL